MSSVEEITLKEVLISALSDILLKKTCINNMNFDHKKIT